jgi:mono/diheme cytochrome c family protein
MTNRSRVVTTLLFLGVASAAAAADPQEGGGSIFKTYCGSCHGTEAKGDGPIAQHLRTVPPDLTRLAQRNKGTFDADKVHRIIDGRDPVKGHGGPDMPVWGDAFRQSREGYSEEKVKARIAALVGYLESVQAGQGQR